MELRRLALLAILAALLTLTVGSAGAAAKTTSYGTQVTIDAGGINGAEGHLSSAQPKCLRGRTVTLFVEDESSGDLVMIATAVSDADGDWEIVLQLSAGEYLAKVESKQVRVKGKRRTCRSARSMRKFL
jgi:hypothetical protein